MNARWIRSALMISALVAGAATASASNPELEAHGPSQAAADILRDVAGADMAFLPAGMVKALDSTNDLSDLLQYPTDTISVVRLSGAQVDAALERSVSLVPVPSSAFLQISGLEVTYSKSAPADNRIVAVVVSGSRLDPNRSYTVAMPTPLARGGLGYFKIWNREAIERTLEGVTLESALRGKSGRAMSSRWIAQ